jgi:nucleoid-associated protein YgaU
MAGEDQKKPDFSDVVSGGSSSAASPPASTDARTQAQRDFEQQRTLRIYVVESGDNLAKIAKKFFGDPNAWRRIFEENRDVIQNPDLIQPGWKLRIPE